MSDNDFEKNPAREGSGNGNKNRNNRHHGYGKNRHGDRRDRNEKNKNIDISAEMESAAVCNDAQPAVAAPEARNTGDRLRQNNRPNQNNRQYQNDRRDKRDSDKRERKPDFNKHDRPKGQPKSQAPEQTRVDEIPKSLVTESFFKSEKEESILGISRDEEAIINSMPPDPTLDEVFNGPAPVALRTQGTEIVGIHFPQGGKVYYFAPAGNKFEKGSYAIVETARGLELGEVAIANRLVADEDIIQPLKPVIRPATETDIAHHETNVKREAEAMKLCMEKIENHKLDMKLTGAQYTFDNAKLIFYFTAAQRVDFRELVKDLASTFHTRIELRQIGTRDEAKMFGGLGVCGRKLCCSAFLPNYTQVSIKMAKKQGLALNSAKISGNCGRLMCCLRYEQSTYERELALMPTVDSIVDTPDGRGVVTDVRPVGYTVKVRLDDKADAAPKLFHLEQIKTIVRAAEKNDDDDNDGENED